VHEDDEKLRVVAMHEFSLGLLQTIMRYDNLKLAGV